MEGTAKPDYATCVKIPTDASIKEMIPPGDLVMLTPLIVGTFFGVETLSGGWLGHLYLESSNPINKINKIYNPNLVKPPPKDCIPKEIQKVAISASSTGGAWDNAKKYIEVGASEHARTLGPKGSEPHKAAVIGELLVTHSKTPWALH
ncbi:Pyrophosphate-energized vacuolar membrane proton pump 1 [Bienertia sinuspersici]